MADWREYGFLVWSALATAAGEVCRGTGRNNVEQAARDSRRFVDRRRLAYRDGRFIYLGRGACIGGGLVGRGIEKAGLARCFTFSAKDFG